MFCFYFSLGVRRSDASNIFFIIFLIVLFTAYYIICYLDLVQITDLTLFFCQKIWLVIKNVLSLQRENKNKSKQYEKANKNTIKNTKKLWR